MIGTMNCTYETPCGWCTKWDKKCDRKIPERGQREKCNLVDDAADGTIKEYIKELSTNKICKSESDHQWECYGVSTAGSTYYCTICGKHKTEPVKNQENITISTYFNYKENDL